MRRTRYSEDEQRKILAAAATLYQEYHHQSLKSYFIAAMRMALTQNRWKDPLKIWIKSPSYAWFRTGVEHLATMRKPEARPPDVKRITTADLIVELFNRVSLAYEETKGIPATVSQLTQRMLALETQVNKAVNGVQRIAHDLGVQEELTPPPDTATPKVVPKPQPRIKIKVVGPLPDQQRIIRSKTNGVDLSFIDSGAMVNLHDFDNCDRAIITRHAKHAAYSAAVSVLGRDKVVRLNTSGLDGVVSTITKMAKPN